MAAPSIDVGPFAPLQTPVFRNIWTASIFANFGHLMMGVAAAWQMTTLTDSEQMIALVQTALMLPMVIVLLPAGAVADMFDRRLGAMFGLGLSSICAVGLTLLALFNLLTPWVLLLFCSLIGAGIAIYTPSWQSSVNEQVPREHVPAAVALGTISYNLARSVGPAIGGLLIAASGVVTVFALNSVFYLPLFIAFFLWRKPHIPSRLPAERIDRAILGGARYVIHSPLVRNILMRAAFMGTVATIMVALAPLVARELLGGDASFFGFILGSAGIGAVIGATFVDRLRRMAATETVLLLSGLMTAACFITIGMSRILSVTCLAVAVASAANIIYVSLLNVGVQTTVPRWVRARALSLFGTSVTFGLAIGAWIWGEAAARFGLTEAFYICAGVTLIGLLLRFVIPIGRPEISEAETITVDFEPDVALAITHRSGPIVIEMEYEVDPQRARAFYEIMRQVRMARNKRGVYNWSISRDIARPERWVERYQCPTWADYLRQRDRFTQADFDLHRKVEAFASGKPEDRICRLLERPFGSVRWKEESVDPHSDAPTFLAP